MGSSPGRRGLRAMKKAPDRPKTGASTQIYGGLYPMQATSTLVIYDLRDPEAWKSAHFVEVTA